MSLFDFFFPEEAQASHLRRLADSTSVANTRTRFDIARQSQAQLSDRKKIEGLQEEVAQLTIVIEALLEKLDEQDLFTRGELAAKVAEIDLRDGVLDGKITKKQSDSSSGGAQLIIPEE